jgi:hypothetical protein
MVIISKEHVTFHKIVVVEDLILIAGGKAIPVRGCGGPQGCKTSMLPHFLDNWLTDGNVVSLTRQRIPVTGRGGP